MSTSSKIKELTRKNNIQFLVSDFANRSRQKYFSQRSHENNLIQTQKTGVTFFVRHSGLLCISNYESSLIICFRWSADGSLPYPAAALSTM